jgi:hypothetical protein
MYNVGATLFYTVGVMINLIASAIQIDDTVKFIRTGNVLWMIGSSFIVIGNVTRNQN